MTRKICFVLLAALLCVGAILALVSRSSAAAPSIGFSPTTLTVKTGQVFYVTVAVTDTFDLYAWEVEGSYNETYLEYMGTVTGEHLRADGAPIYFVPPASSTGAFKNGASTRLGQDEGVDGNGAIAHVFFRARKQNLGGTTVTLGGTYTRLANRNAREISKSLYNSGRCKIIIGDDAPVLVQSPVGERVFLPVVRR